MRVDLTPLPMAEAQAFWADKVQLGPGEFAKLSAEAKVKAFAVSGIARGDELTTVFEAIRRAIDQGTTLADFKKECGAIFERRGWTGKRTWRVDNIGSSPRLRGTHLLELTAVPFILWVVNFYQKIRHVPAQWIDRSPALLQGKRKPV